MKKRIGHLKKIIKDNDLDGVILTSLSNIRYFTSFSGASGLAFLGRNFSYLLVDFRYFEQAKIEARNFKVEIVGKNFFNKLAEIVKSHESLKTLGFEEDNLTFSLYRQAKEKLKEVKLVPLQLSNVRIIKEEKEIEKIKKAAKIADNSFSEIIPFIKPGVQENDIALELEYLMRRKGAEKASFDIIVASGNRSSMPHAKTSVKKIRKGELIKIDWGCVYEGYCSDCTRTLALGEIDEEKKKIYYLVKEAQKMALEILSVGRRVREIDQKVRKHFSRFGVEKRFGHNLGHGVGLEVHEAPTINSKSKEVLKSRMVFTIEPGLYFEGIGGVRIEDMVVLRENGPEILTSFSKELIEL